MTVHLRLFSRSGLHFHAATGVWQLGFSTYDKLYTVIRELTITCIERPPISGPIHYFYSIKVLLNNDHLATTATIFGSQGWSFCTQVWLYFASKLIWFQVYRILNGKSQVEETKNECTNSLEFYLWSEKLKVNYFFSFDDKKYEKGSSINDITVIRGEGFKYFVTAVLRP